MLLDQTLLNYIYAIWPGAGTVSASLAQGALTPRARFVKLFWRPADKAEEHTLRWQAHFVAELDARPQPSLNAVARAVQR